MSLSRRTFALLLALSPEIGGKTVSAILARCEMNQISPEEFMSLSPETWAEQFKLKPKAIESLLIQKSSKFEESLEVERTLQGQGVRLITTNDGKYPPMLEEMDSAPPGFLFAYGNLPLLTKPRFCVLASRQASTRALELIERTTEENILKGKVLVSGVDRLEYQRSSVVPLRWGTPRILCLDRGLYETFGKDLSSEPFATARLWRFKFDPTVDLALTPFRPDAHCVGVNNQVRDRMIAGLSHELNFVEVSPKGNMEGLLKKSLEANRTVFVSELLASREEWIQKGAQPMPSLNEKP